MTCMFRGRWFGRSSGRTRPSFATSGRSNRCREFWREQLEALLDENDGRPARERLTIRIFEDLRALGYGGSYVAVRRYAIAWREKRASTTADAYVPLSFAPGEAYQFDWSHEIALIVV